MALLFIIPILVSGYFYLTSSHLHKNKVKKLEGQQLYFRSAFYGFIITFISITLTAILIKQEVAILNTTLSLKAVQEFMIEHIFYAINLQSSNNIDYLNHVSTLQESKRNIGFYSFFILCFFISIFITYVWNLLHRSYYVAKDLLGVISSISAIQRIRALFHFLEAWSKKGYFYLRHQLHLFNKGAEKNEKSNTLNNLKDVWWRWKHGIAGIKKEIKNPLDNLLYESIEYHQQLKGDVTNPRLIMLTMRDRKVYVGLVIGFGKDNDVFSLSNETFYFLPMKSGYRNKYDLRICMTTDYSKAIDTIIQRQGSLDELQIILNKNQIVSACEFDDSRFKSFDKSPQFFQAS